MRVMQILPTDPLRKLGIIVGWGVLCSGWSIPITFALWFGAGKCEQSVRNYDPCISCATHFLGLHLERD
jgi:hypothetical protein